MQGNKINVVTGKAAFACSSVLGLALGMGAIAPAQAALFITDFTPANQAAYNAGTAVSFGPSYDPTGFTAQRTADFLSTYFTLTGYNGNGVAILAGCTPNCQLEVFPPGSQVDGTATFGPTGSFKVSGYNPIKDESFNTPNGNYYFGLSDVNMLTEDPYGWMEITLQNGGVTLDRFAFEDTERTPAPIPLAVDVPEPITLSLFAVGGAAVLAARRRRRNAK